jgi:hypothetical protein
LALATRVRSLHNEYNKTENNKVVHGQIKNLRFRIKLIKQMQALGVMAFFKLHYLYVFYLYRMDDHEPLGFLPSAYSVSLVHWLYLSGKFN